MTTRSQNMAMRANQVRSQDDHSVEYYGRPQNQVSGPFGPRRGWGVNAGMDDSVLTDVRKRFVHVLHMSFFLVIMSVNVAKALSVVQQMTRDTRVMNH